VYHYILFKIMFESETAKKGGVIRRKVSDINKYASVQLLVAEVKRRGFPMLETGGWFVIFCNSQPYKVIN